MNKTIVSILLILMFITPIFSISAIEENTSFHQKDCSKKLYSSLGVPSSKWLIGADQMQINDMESWHPHESACEWAQAFIPTKDTLTAVAFYYRREGNPHKETTITVSIREELDGPDLTNITVLAWDYRIKNFPPFTWILFDFPDINVTPEQTYYIYETQSHGEWIWGSCYGILSTCNNPYNSGEPWIKFPSIDWMKLEEYFSNPIVPNPDFCFITYHDEPKAKSYLHPFLTILDQHLHLFPRLRFILNDILTCQMNRLI